jgi:hypothetical protein
MRAGVELDVAEGLHLAGTHPKVLKAFCFVYYN